jgi:hypothetical protein
MTQAIAIKKDWNTVIWLILFFPVGLYKMWRSPQFLFKFKVIITTIFILPILIMKAQGTVNGSPVNSSQSKSRVLAAENSKVESDEIKERKADARGEIIRKKYNNGIFVSSMVVLNPNEYVFRLSTNESQWTALNQKQKHQLVTFVHSDFRKEFCVDILKKCRIELEGMYSRKLASTTVDHRVVIEK